MSKTCYDCDNCLETPLCGITLCPIEPSKSVKDCPNFTPIEECPKTVFNRITTSQEVLAKFLVFHNCIRRGRTKYHSAVVGGEFDRYEEAYAATVAKLKEVQSK